ncbi:MAG: hypothetical protein KDB69_09760 [Acidimicrobiia bacterium]|nr:hypothetical protein [Acidimicrobiia bacterium]
MDPDEPYLDESMPGYVPDGERFDRPVPSRRIRKIVQSIAAIVLASMLAAAGTPVSWVAIGTGVLMLLIWTELSTRRDDTDDVI